MDGLVDVSVIVWLQYDWISVDVAGYVDESTDVDVAFRADDDSKLCFHDIVLFSGSPKILI